MKTPAEGRKPAGTGDQNGPAIGWTLDIIRQLEKLSSELGKIESSS
jgi:phage terminase small subunit